MADYDQILNDASEQAILEYLKSKRWNKLNNYEGIIFDNHIILCKIHSESDIIDKANYKTILLSGPNKSFSAVFNHYRYGDLKMILLEINQPIEILKEAAQLIAKFEMLEVICEKDLLKLEEEEIDNLWLQMTPKQREDIALQAGKPDNLSMFEREQESPDWNHQRTIEILKDLIYN